MINDLLCSCTHQSVISTRTHPFRGSFFNTEDFDSFGKMELVVFKVSAEERGLRPRVREGYADVADDRGFVLFYAQLRGALLEDHLEIKHEIKREELQMFAHVFFSFH